MVKLSSYSQNGIKSSFDFYGDSIEFKLDSSVLIPFREPLSEQSVQSFYKKISDANYQSVIEALLLYKETNNPDDWLYYQLIRKTAQHISPKADNYWRYTLYKWFFLVKSGYHAALTMSGDKLLFYVQSEEKIYNIPSRISDGNQFVCLNYHDYGTIDFEKEKFSEINIDIPDSKHPFSYKVTQLPDFNPANYSERDISFNYYQNNYHFKVKLNPQIQAIFANYPVVDYSYYFNIPLSKETYMSLIPLIKKNIKGMTKKNGIDYLMRFTRYAFLFEKDTEIFGKEKRLSPEETLLYEHSDCEDRAALFFCLVKEIYNLPMIVLVYPKHVTIAVQLDKPVGNPIVYNGKKYSICEPTPQTQDLRIGQRIPTLSKTPYEIVYAYNPGERK
ncbi:MAG: hypothetical protein H7122_04790 [Chitinophagaceae bacterium]|nr:hypothetical protein [Chitinophagaceae bacterium]